MINGGWEETCGRFQKRCRRQKQNHQRNEDEIEVSIKNSRQVEEYKGQKRQGEWNWTLLNSQRLAYLQKLQDISG